MPYFLWYKTIFRKAKEKKRKIFLQVANLKPLISNRQFIRKLIAVITATGLCVVASGWLTSKSSLGTNYYTYTGFLAAIIVSLILAPPLLNYALERAKARSPAWSYWIGAKAGSWLGVAVSLIVGFLSISLKARWLLEELRIALAALTLTLISGLVIGGLIGMLLLPILRLIIYGSCIIKK